MSESPQRVVILGGGYAGALAAVRVAGRSKGKAEVTLVDPRERLVQRLRLHQVAAGQAVPSYDLRALTGRRVRNVRGWAHAIDVNRSVVLVRGGEGAPAIPFDQLIVATGSTVDLTQVPGVAEHAHCLSTPETAARLHGALTELSEGATVAVCGGGLTGLEAAGEFAAARPDLRVVLVTAGALGEWLAPKGRDRLGRSLERLGIEVVDRATVTGVEPEAVHLASGGRIAVGATVWCGGFRAGPLVRESGLATDHRGALRVDPTLRVPGHPEVLAAGDAAAVPSLPGGAAFRMTCQAGMPAGAHAADTVVAAIRGRDATPFDFGYIHQPVSLGRRDALVQFVDRADRPRDRVLSGRRAALYKHLVTAGAVPSIGMERRLPGALKWPAAGRPRAVNLLERAGSAS